MPKILILVAEDEPDILEMMRVFLEMEDFSVIEAKDGREAVYMVIENHPDLVFMDIAMPGVDGIQAAKMIRGNPEVSGTPIVAVSAYGSYFAAAARDAGCDLLIRKPVELDTLKGIVRRFLPEQRATSDPVSD